MNDDARLALVAGQIAGLAMPFSARQWQEAAARLSADPEFRYGAVMRAVASMRVLLDARGNTGSAPEPTSKE